MRIACVLITHFYVKNELIRNPELKNIPFVVVTKNKNDLIVVDKSAEAKAIKIGMSYQSAISMHGDVIVIKGDYVMYGEVHQKNMLSLNHISPKIECGGLGMVFVDITGLEMLYKNMDNLKQKILSSIPQEFNPRVGIADNKFFSYIAALESAPNQCMDYIDSVEFRSKIGVDILPIASTNKAKLKELGINNLTQIADWNINLLQIQFGIKEGKKIWELAQGIDSDLFNHTKIEPSLKKIIETYDFWSTRESILLVISYMLDDLLSDSMFKNKSARGVIMDFRTNDEQFSNKKINFKEPLFSKSKMMFVISNVLETVKIPGPVDRISIELIELTNDFGIQKSLFQSSRKKENLLESIKQLEVRLGGKVPIYKIKEIEPCSKIPERRSALVRILP